MTKLHRTHLRNSIPCPAGNRLRRPVFQRHFLKIPQVACQYRCTVRQCDRCDAQIHCTYANGFSQPLEFNGSRLGDSAGDEAFEIFEVILQFVASASRTNLSVKNKPLDEQRSWSAMRTLPVYLIKARRRFPRGRMARPPSPGE